LFKYQIIKFVYGTGTPQADCSGDKMGGGELKRSFGDVLFLL
jgi:hypothetical protein